MKNFFFISGYFVGIFWMVGIAKSFGILLEQFVDYFDIPVAMAALIMGVAGGMYTLAGMIFTEDDQNILVYIYYQFGHMIKVYYKIQYYRQQKFHEQLVYSLIIILN
jgi:hypothetical protein